MKTIKGRLTIIIFFLWHTSAVKAQGGTGILKLWETSPTLLTSESVCYNKTGDFFFVSCINGNPVTKDGNGYIAKVDMKGNIIAEKWATGLDAPKGMGINGDSLFVSDIDRVVVIDLNSGSKIKVYPVQGAKFLNDIAIGPGGEIFISDMASNTIVVIRQGRVETFIENKHLKNPNGLLISGKYLFIGTNEGIYRAKIETGKFLRIIDMQGGIDGLKTFDDDKFIVSDWYGKVTVVDEDGATLLLDNSKSGVNAADFEYLQDKKLLVIPTFSDNRVVAYSIEKTGEYDE